jgi:7,8-dihydro-6-hydroxymethylpterin dimethyltransferase
MNIDHRIQREYIYHDLTQGMCRECRAIVDAQVLFRDGSVYLRSICPTHGASEALIAQSSEWYRTTVTSRQLPDPPKRTSTSVSKGCPLDCGLCEWHEKACHLPIFSITNACNLKCPICFTYNREDRKFYMSEEEFQGIIDWIIESEGQVDLINITGGEPTLHPDLMNLIRRAKRKEIGRITLNTNGIRLTHDPELLRQLAEEGIYIVLSFNTLHSDVTVQMHGADILPKKLETLKLLEQYNIPTTLLTVCAKGVNDGELGSIVDLMLSHDFIRSLTVQTMTYTGFGGRSFYPRRHLPIDTVIDTIVRSHPEIFRHSDFTPLPGTHPLCYSVAYLFHHENAFLPLRRIFTDDEYERVVGNKYLIHPDEGLHELLRNKIDEIWAHETGDPDAERKLRVLKRIIEELYPVGRNLSAFDRQKIAEKFFKTIYIHAHMDEDTFDVSRVVRCGDLVPDGAKTFIPACSYNLFYRMKDSRFWSEET